MKLKTVPIMSLFAGLTLLGSCATGTSLGFGNTAAGNRFLVENVDGPAKAALLTEQGAAKLRQIIRKDKEYTRIAEVKAYFIHALALDPGNAEAQAYLDELEDLRFYLRDENIKAARNYLDKKTLSTADEYRLLKAVQSAVYYDPDSPEVRELAAKVRERRDRMVTTLHDQTLAAIRKARSSGSGSETPYLEAFQLATKAFAIAPDDGRAWSDRQDILGDMRQIIDRKLKDFDKLMEQGRFRECERAVTIAADLNRKIDNPFDTEITNARYRLEYAWASWHFGQKDYAKAEERVRKAIALKQTPEAAGLLDRITSTSAGIAGSGLFDQSIAKLDARIAKSDLAGAVTLIPGIRRQARTATQKADMDRRLRKLSDMLPSVYEDALAAYKSENLDKAIDLLEQIVLVDSSFREAAEYLDKARSKKRLLDQY